MQEIPPQPDALRYELMPFGSAEREAAAFDAPLTVTVTCSPKHGPDHTVAVAGRLHGLGHTVVAHIAARMVRGPGHLDELLSAMRDQGVLDVFLVGGDAAEPAGPYGSSFELLEAMRAHRCAPRTIGVTAYPEGHPIIPDDVLVADLERKSSLADYLTTQMCFDAKALLRWLDHVRSLGIELPAYVGLPGAVDRKRLLEISMRVGVGTSIAFLRKQRHARELLSGGHETAARLHEAIAPEIGGRRGIAGVHFFTFNRLAETVALVQSSGARRAEPASA